VVPAVRLLAGEAGLAREVPLPSGTTGDRHTAGRESRVSSGSPAAPVRSVLFFRFSIRFRLLFSNTFTFRNVSSMHIRSSFAAAVAAAMSAVVFSAAFQPVQASIIVIDDFTQSQSATNSGGSNIANVSATDNKSGDFGGFSDRATNATYGQASTRGVRTVQSTSNSSGTGTLQLTNDGAGNGTTPVSFSNGAFSYFGYLGTSIDLTGQQGFWIETAATSSTPANAFKGFMQVSTLGSAETVTYDLPGMWAPNTGTGILFETLLAINSNLDFTQVDAVYVGIRNTGTLDGSTAYNATANFTAISVVPEPSQMVFVAGVGATLGAWRLRKLRRNRAAAEAAAV
jgi:hypothetical protein